LKTIALVFAFAVLNLTARAVATPEEVARGYMDAVKSGDMEHVGVFMHPAALEKFKGILVQLAGVIGNVDAETDPKKNTAIRVLFGDEKPQTVKDALAKNLFVHFLTNLSQAMPMLRQMLNDSTYDFIGHVDEGGNQTHVVYRATLTTGGTAVTKMEVLTLKRDGEEWKVMLTGDIESFVGGLTRQLQHK
jgi:hypothetical protein